MLSPSVSRNDEPRWSGPKGRATLAQDASPWKETRPTPINSPLPRPRGWGNEGEGELLRPHGLNSAAPQPAG